jgi:hypothetical protein
MFADGTPYGHGPKSENIEILYNYFRRDDGGPIEFNRYNDQGTTWIYRNTFVCGLQMTKLDSDCDGPWFIDDNIFENSSSGISYHSSCTGDYTACVSKSGNIGSTSGVVDSNGLLLSNYSSHIGLVGWQFPNGSTPINGDYVPIVPLILPPTNLTISDTQ